MAADSKAIVGRLNWVATETSSGSRIANGQKLVKLADVTLEGKSNTRSHERAMEIQGELLKDKSAVSLNDPVFRKEFLAAFTKRLQDETSRQDEDWERQVGPPWFTKTIPPDSIFELGFAEYPEENRLGFGLYGGRRDQRTFSWEWFNVSGSDAAVKLQESGVVRFRTMETARGVEMIYLSFETDISLRLHPMGNADVLEARWRITIRKGSEIYWPSLVEGRVIPNGNL